VCCGISSVVEENVAGQDKTTVCRRGGKLGRRRNLTSWKARGRPWALTLEGKGCMMPTVQLHFFTFAAGLGLVSVFTFVGRFCVGALMVTLKGVSCELSIPAFQYF